MAQKFSMEFTSNSGAKRTVTFDESDWTASADGFTGPYKVDLGTKQLHTSTPNGEMMNGDKGTATIVAVG